MGILNFFTGGNSKVAEKNLKQNVIVPSERYDSLVEHK